MQRIYLILLCISCMLISSCNLSASASAPQRIAHPDDLSKDVEYFLERPLGNAPWPTVILLHGHQDGMKPGGKEFVDWGVLKQLAERGYLAVAISQPGYGKSAGPADFCGVFTQRAVAGVIAKLRAERLTSPNKLLIQGISRGALTASLVAAQDASISGLVLISGLYDLPAYIKNSDESIAKRAIVSAMIAETGGSTDALLARSVLHRAADIKASVLILNGANDDRTDPNQARSLANQITRAGGKAHAIIYNGIGHKIPIELRAKDIDPFISEVLGSAGR